jgi:DNA sulfur modification protein DndE
VLPNRFRISKASTESLKQLKARTGVTPNVACRIALMLSLERGSLGGERDVDLEGAELYTHTLFGEGGQIYEYLLRQVHGDMDPKKLNLVVASHIESGTEELKKIKNLLDLCALMTPSARMANRQAARSPARASNR